MITTAPSRDHFRDFISQSKSVNSRFTTQRYEVQVGRFIKFAVKHGVEYSKALVNQWLEQELINFARSSTSVAERAVRSFYSWLAANDIIPANPLALVKVMVNSPPKKEKQVFTLEEFAAIKSACLDHPDSHWLGAALVAWHTGLRLADVAQLRWDQIDFLSETITLIPQKITKTNRCVQIPMAPNLRDWLAQNRASNSSQFVLPMMNGSYKLDGPTRLSIEFRAICAKAKVPKGKSFHTLRRTFNTRAIQSGVSPAIISQITGQNISTVMAYVTINLDTKRQAINQMA